MSTSTSPPQPALHSKESYTTTVETRDLASEIGSDSARDPFPRVLATSRLVAFMEIAAARVLQPLLNEKQLSVGTRVDISHSAPTPIGAQVTATAEFVGMKGKVFLFEVEASDEGGVVGRGTHERAIVDVERLEGGARKRTARDAA